MADQIRVDYEQLRDIAARFAREAEANQRTYQAVQRRMTALQSGWSGRGSDAFFAEMTGVVLPALNRLTQALRAAREQTLKMSAIFAAAEEDASRPFLQRESGGLFSLDGANNLVRVIDGLKNLFGFGAAVAIAAGLQKGSAYAGEVIIAVPQALTKFGISATTWRSLADIDQHLTHIAGENMAEHIGRIKMPKPGAVAALLFVAKGAIAVGQTWNAHRAEYAGMSTTAHYSAMAVDAGLALIPEVTGAAGAFAGGALGKLGGAALGAWITGPAAPGGAIVGGAVGGLVGAGICGWAGEQGGKWLVGKITEAYPREQMIRAVDDNIARPLADEVNKAGQALRGWYEPAAAM